MIRINVVAEGQSEMFFAKRVLNSYFNGSRIVNSRCVLTSTDNRINYEYRGGMGTYEHARNDIIRWLKEDKDAYVTTMFDFYRLPKDFPGFEEARRQKLALDSVKLLEQSLFQDITEKAPGISRGRFFPYIQLHEFESLLYTDLSVLECDYLDIDDRKAIEKLLMETKNIPPEEINNGDNTAPSKRLMNAVGYRKGSAPALWLELITVDRILEKCQHFADWINTLSGLS